MEYFILFQKTLCNQAKMKKHYISITFVVFVTLCSLILRREVGPSSALIRFRVIRDHRTSAFQATNLVQVYQGSTLLLPTLLLQLNTIFCSV